MRSFDVRQPSAHVLVGEGCEHIYVDHGGGVVRLDLVAGTALAGPISLCFDLHDDERLPAKLEALRQFAQICASAPTERSHTNLANRLLALHAFDLRAAGIGLRRIAAELLGSGDWPGDGDHRKSRTRRLVAVGEAMVRAGPGAILS
jgi:hypothetical protein